MAKALGPQLRAQLHPQLRSRLSGPEAFIPAVAEELHNPSWEHAAQRILILRLSPFDDVAGSQAHLILFSECRRALEGAFIDFAFLPDSRDRAILAAEGLPFYYGLVSGMPPEEFDLIMISNSFVLELVNLSYLFGPDLPSRASERMKSEKHLPLIVMGGSNAAASGAVILPGSEDESAGDCLVDGIFFGEGEALHSENAEPLDTPLSGPNSDCTTALTELVLALAGDPKSPRPSRLERASRVRGFWPALSGKHVVRSIARPYPAPLSSYPVLNSSEASTARLQISSGCHGMCSFCLEGWDRRPYREIPAGEIIEAARRLRSSVGADTVELFSYNFNTHTSILELVFELGRVFKRVNLMSQRLDILGRLPVLFAAETAADKRSFTLGIEGISQSMRALYQKGISEADIETCIDLLVKPGVRELKLFFIVSGFEGDDDIEEFSELISRFAQAKRDKTPGLRVLVSCGYLVRLPFTPLQYAPLILERHKLEGITERLRSICESEGIEFRLSTKYEEYFADQILALGGRKLGPWIENTSSAGHIYDSGLSKGVLASLEAEARKAGLLDPVFLGEKPGSWRPPLAFVDTNWNVLWENYRRARSRLDRSNCLGIVEGSPGSCSSCGACETAEDRKRITGHAITLSTDAPTSVVSRIARLVEAKRRLHSILVIVELPPSLARATESYRSSWVTRLLASRATQEFKAVLEVRDAFFGAMFERYWGKAMYSLWGPDLERLRAASKKAAFGIIESFAEPGSVEIELRLPLQYASSARATLDSWLKNEHIDIVETHPDSTRSVLEASGKSTRKHLLYRAELFVVDGSEPDGYVMQLSLGAKADIKKMMKTFPPELEHCSSLQVISWK
jgi:hypothetical protein